MRNRINRFYSHPALGDMLDSGELDLHLLNIFEELVSVHRTVIICDTAYANQEVLCSPLFEALFDCNLIWKSKYYGYFRLDSILSAHVIYEWC